MKKIQWGALLIILFLVAMVFTACANELGGNICTVTYLSRDGRTVLDTIQVEKGENAPYWEPLPEEGYEFVNWYEDKEQTRLFDFKGEPITKSKNIYAGFAKTGTVDTRRWAISGEGQGDVLLASRSGTVIADIHLLKKAVTKNEFTIRLDLYEGDEFRFVAEGDATHQRGIGYVASFDRTLQINNKEQEVFLEKSDGGESDKQGNIVVKYSGNYTFKLKTYIEEDNYETGSDGGKFSVNKYDSITWEYNGPAAELDESYVDYYIKGKEITNGGDVYNDFTRMVRVGKTYTMSVFLRANDRIIFTSKRVSRKTGEEKVEEFVIVESMLNSKSRRLFSTGINSMMPLTDGLYKFVYNDETQILDVTVDESAKMEEYDDYYIEGNIAEGERENTTSGKTNRYRMLKQVDGTFIAENVKLSVGDEFIIRGMQADGEQTTGHTENVYDYSHYVGRKGLFNAAGKETNGNIVTVKADNYDIKFEPYSKIISIVPTDTPHTVYIKGNFAPDENITDSEGYLLEQYRLKETSDGVFEITMTITDEMVEWDTWTCLLMLDTADGENGTRLGVEYLGTDTIENVNSLFRRYPYKLATQTAGTYRFVFDLKTKEINIYDAPIESDEWTDYYIKGEEITYWADIYNESTRMQRNGSLYTMTIYLRAGDEFIFTGLDVNGDTSASGTEYIKWYNLDESSKSLFDIADFSRSNILVEKSGEYTFTYNAKTQKLNAILDQNGKLPSADYYLDGKIGALDWGDTFYNSEYKFQFVKNDIYKLDITLNKGDAIKIQAFSQGATEQTGEKLSVYGYDHLYIGEGNFDKGSNNSLLTLKDGNYSIVFDAYAKVIEIYRQSIPVYIKGNFVGPDWDITDENGNLIDEYRLTETSDGIYEITMTISQTSWQGGIQYNTTDGKNGIFIDTSYLGDAEGNCNYLFGISGCLKCSTVGTYRFEFNMDTMKLNIFKAGGR